MFFFFSRSVRPSDRDKAAPIDLAFRRVRCSASSLVFEHTFGYCRPA
jgi:hypothetical protein